MICIGTFCISILKVLIIFWVGGFVFLIIYKVIGGDASFNDDIYVTNLSARLHSSSV
jgi:hypothetical protein